MLRIVPNVFQRCSHVQYIVVYYYHLLGIFVLGIWKLGTQKSGNLGSNSISKMQIINIKIRSAQNISKVQISSHLAYILGESDFYFEISFIFFTFCGVPKSGRALGLRPGRGPGPAPPLPLTWKCSITSAVTGDFLAFWLNSWQQ